MDRREDGIAEELRAPDRARRLDALERLLARGGTVPDSLLDPLAACVGDRSKAVQRRAADALARIADRDAVRAALAPVLRDADAERRWGAAYALGVAVGPEAILLPALVDVLGSSDGDRRWAAAELVIAMGRRKEHVEHVAGELLGLAASANPRQRKMALYCIRDLGMRGDAVETTSRQCLADDDAAVRLAALSLARRSGRAEALVDPVIEALEHDPDLGVRRAAAATLGAWRRLAPAAAALERATESEDASLRRAATQALRHHP
jgi:HEAT repeat protein